MQIYCVSCKKDTRNKNSKVFRRKNGRLLLKSHCFVCGNKRSRFIKEQETKRILSQLGIRTPLSKILLLNILF